MRYPSPRDDSYLPSTLMFGVPGGNSQYSFGIHALRSLPNIIIGWKSLAALKADPAKVATCAIRGEIMSPSYSSNMGIVCKLNGASGA